jgi:cell volume regulation protein A
VNRTPQVASTAAAAAWMLDISLLEGILLGSIIGSTDAAAVFSVLRSAGVSLDERLAAILEVESGSNDPMAVFLTVGLLEVLLGRVALGPDLLKLFIVQMGVGTVIGLAVGRLSVQLINRINLSAVGLYPVLTGACGMLSFGLAAVLGGSGYLAVYIAGMVFGNSRLVSKRVSFLFYDGLAWAGQISMFVVLGLVSRPSQLIDVAPQGLVVTAVLALVARPVTTFLLLSPFRFNVRELTLISWVGLKGAVPIILATFPLLVGLSSGALLFNVVFFVVLLSAVVQGSSIPWVARLLKLEQPPAPVSLEISSLADVDADIVEYTVEQGARASGRRLSQLALPEGAVVAMIARNKSLIPPRGSTEIRAGDHIFVVIREETRFLVDHIFQGAEGGISPIPHDVEMCFVGSTTLGELAEIHGLELPAGPEYTLDALLREQLHKAPEPEDSVTLNGIRLRVREAAGGRAVSVGLTLLSPPAEVAEHQQRASLTPSAAPSSAAVEGEQRTSLVAPISENTDGGACASVPSDVVANSDDAQR